MTLFESSVCVEKTRGQATILAIGTTTPSNCFYQVDYPDYYFRVTNNEHMVDLKKKFERICDKTQIKKRYMLITEKFLKENPNVCEFMAPSLNARQDLLVAEIPKLGQEDAIKAIDEWGHPRSKITHLIFCTSSGVDMPGADYQLVKLFGLSPMVKRLMMYQQGCSAGAMILRLAKDLAENNKGSRILVVCSESCATLFQGPNENHLESLVGQALFSDGAAAIIVGSDPELSTEHPLFEIVSTTQTILEDTDMALKLHLREEGLTLQLRKDVPKMISKNIEDVLRHTVSSLGISDWNSLFLVVHPGGRAILDGLELKLNLNKEKLRASRHVLSEYGNMASASVLFIVDEMSKKSMEEGKSTTGEGLDWGVLFGFGPGLTIETVVLRSVSATTPVAFQN